MLRNLIRITLLISFFYLSSAYAADFTLPNSGNEPIVIDISGLNITSGIDVNIGEFNNQPRTYRDDNTKSIVVFPPALTSSEKVIQVRAGN